MRSISIAVITATLVLFAANVAQADDVSDVKAAEIAFNAARNSTKPQSRATFESPACGYGKRTVGNWRIGVNPISDKPEFRS